TLRSCTVRIGDDEAGAGAGWVGAGVGRVDAGTARAGAAVGCGAASSDRVCHPPWARRAVAKSLPDTRDASAVSRPVDSGPVSRKSTSSQARVSSSTWGPVMRTDLSYAQ